MRGNFVMLRAGTLRLLLRQEEVGTAVHVDPARPPQGTVALSELMRPLAPFPRERFVVTRLLPDEGGRDFAWDEARVLIDAELRQHPLPPSMRSEGAPVDGYVVHEGELVLCTRAARLIAAAGEAR